MPRTHYLPDDERVHFTWDTGHEPVLGIDSGDTVVVWTRDVSDNQIGPDSRHERDRRPRLGSRLPARRTDRGRAAPQPGDTLAVEILDIHTQGWGWTAILPGLGLLPDEFPDPYLKIFDISGADVRLDARGRGDPAGAVLRDDGRLPGRCLRLPVMPPGNFGGNLDTRQLVAARRCTCRSRSPARCSRAATPTAARATARSA